MKQIFKNFEFPRWTSKFKSSFTFVNCGLNFSSALKFFVFKNLYIIFIFFLLSTFSYSQQTNFFRTYGLGVYDVGEAVLVNNDTTYLVAGVTNSNNGNGTDFLLFKTNSVGDLLWRKQYGGNGPDGAKAATAALDNGGYFIAGYQNNIDSSGYNIWLIKTNTNGDTVWTKTYGGAGWDFAHSITTLADSTYVIAGETYSYGNGQRDVYLIRFDLNGDTLWTKTYGGTGNDAAKYIFTDRNNNLVVIGNTDSYGAGNSDVYILHLDLNGDTLWTKTIGTVDDDFGYSVDMYIDTVMYEMDFVIGYTSYYAPDQGQNTYLARIDSVDGNVQATYPEGVVSIILFDKPHVVQIKPGAITFFADYREAYNQNCIPFCERDNYNFFPAQAKTFAGGGNENTSQNAFKIALDGGCLVTGYSENWGPGVTSAFLLKTDTLLASPDTPTVGLPNLKSDPLSIFPNPVTGNYFYINSRSEIHQVQVFDMSGQLIKTYSTGTSEKSVALEKPFTTSGMYIVEIGTSAGIVRKKIIF
jgi:hypothetical protein